MPQTTTFAKKELSPNQTGYRERMEIRLVGDWVIGEIPQPDNSQDPRYLRMIKDSKQ